MNAVEDWGGGGGVPPPHLTFTPKRWGIPARPDGTKLRKVNKNKTSSDCQNNSPEIDTSECSSETLKRKFS